MSEKILQAVLMRRALLELQHQIALPNDTSFYTWEADLITVNKSGYTNEYECKISRADYLRDKSKDKFKWFDYRQELDEANLPEHLRGIYQAHQKSPNYFWYATLDFDIEPPAFAGWLKVSKLGRVYKVAVMKPAPLRHKQKPNKRLIEIAPRLLSFKLMKFYDAFAVHKDG